MITSSCVFFFRSGLVGLNLPHTAAFRSANNFNQPISAWDVAKVTTLGNWSADPPTDTAQQVQQQHMLSYLFLVSCSSFFDQQTLTRRLYCWPCCAVILCVFFFISFLITSSCVSFVRSWARGFKSLPQSAAFYYATNFNQPIGDWDVAKVTTLSNSECGSPTHTAQQAQQQHMLSYLFLVSCSSSTTTKRPHTASIVGPAAPSSLCTLFVFRSSLLLWCFFLSFGPGSNLSHLQHSMRRSNRSSAAHGRPRSSLRFNWAARPRLLLPHLHLVPDGTSHRRRLHHRRRRKPAGRAIPGTRSTPSQHRASRR